MLKEEEFKKLDCLADHARSDKERFPGGMWKLKELYIGVDEPVPYPMHATQQDWKALFDKLDRWVAARPQSITARVALASAYLGYASDARGEGTVDTVTENGWKLFGERIVKARQILQSASPFPTSARSGMSLCWWWPRTRTGTRQKGVHYPKRHLSLSRVITTVCPRTRKPPAAQMGRKAGRY
jgi:hypothetical protein